MSIEYTGINKETVVGEIKNFLVSLVAETGAQSATDFGKVMPLASKALSGKADGKVISNLLREILK